MRIADLFLWRRWLCLSLLAVLPVSAFAHGGEDHSAEQAPVVAAGAGMVARTARAGDWEVVIKHPALEPDKELAARVFVTRFDSNEPVRDAQIMVTITSDGAPLEVQASANSTPGVYEVKLPPMPRGQYQLAARVSANGANQTAQYGAIQVAPVPPPTVESSTGWARMVLIALAVLAGLGVLGVFAYRALLGVRPRGSKEAATA